MTIIADLQEDSALQRARDASMLGRLIRRQPGSKIAASKWSEHSLDPRNLTDYNDLSLNPSAPVIGIDVDTGKLDIPDTHQHIIDHWLHMLLGDHLGRHRVTKRPEHPTHGIYWVKLGEGISITEVPTELHINGIHFGETRKYHREGNNGHYGNITGSAEGAEYVGSIAPIDDLPVFNREHLERLDTKKPQPRQPVNIRELARRPHETDELPPWLTKRINDLEQMTAGSGRNTELYVIAKEAARYGCDTELTKQKCEDAYDPLTSKKKMTDRQLQTRWEQSWQSGIKAGEPLRQQWLAQHSHKKSHPNPVPEAEPAPDLDLWSHPRLKLIYKLAQYSEVNPHALLSAVMARLGGKHRLILPIQRRVAAESTCAIITVLIGTSNEGKSGLASLASELIPIDYCPQWPNSAEGLYDSLLEEQITEDEDGNVTKQLVQVKDAVFLYSGENTLTDGASSRRITQFMRQMWSGESLSLSLSKARGNTSRAQLAKRSYTVGMIICCTWAETGELTNKKGGTKQRIIWADVNTEPHEPHWANNPLTGEDILDRETKDLATMLDLPIIGNHKVEVAPEVKQIIYDLMAGPARRARREDDAHNVLLQERIAALLNLLQCDLTTWQPMVTLSDWHQAQHLIDYRGATLATLAAKEAEAAAAAARGRGQIKSIENEAERTHAYSRWLTDWTDRIRNKLGTTAQHKQIANSLPNNKRLAKYGVDRSQAATDIQHQLTHNTQDVIK